MKLFLKLQDENLNMNDYSQFFAFEETFIRFIGKNGAKVDFEFDSTSDRDDALSKINDEFTLII